ncbi:uncharacterized protein LOC144038803 [Vanacampus margaritifer]
MAPVWLVVVLAHAVLMDIGLCFPPEPAESDVGFQKGAHNDVSLKGVYQLLKSLDFALMQQDPDLLVTEEVEVELDSVLSLDVPSRNMSLDGPSRNMSLDGPSRNMSLDGPSRNMSLDGPSRNMSLDGPSRNMSLDGPSRNMSLDGPSRNMSLDGPSLYGQIAMLRQLMDWFSRMEERDERRSLVECWNAAPGLRLWRGVEAADPRCGSSPGLKGRGRGVTLSDHVSSDDQEKFMGPDVG